MNLAILSNSPDQVITESEAFDAASIYVTDHIDASLNLGTGSRFYHKPLDKEIWQFLLCMEQTPLHPIAVDAQTGTVLPLTDREIDKIQQRAVIARGVAGNQLPVDEHGYILAEYARRKTNGYLSREVSIFCGATDGVLIPIKQAIWQFAIRFRLPEHGEIGILGTIDMDACSGEIIPLLPQQIEQMKARANAIVEFQTQSAAR